MAEPGDALLAVRDVWKSYAVPGQADPVHILRGVCLELPGAATAAILGPSGSGKSTLLNIVGALDRPSRGSVHVAGRDIATMSEKELALLRNRDIGFVFQLHHLLPQCTALENVLVPTLAQGRGVSSPEQVARGRDLLQRVGLGDRMQCIPAQLSGGERQRVAVVRALINQPRLVLADEPTGALDNESAEELGDLLIELNAAEQTALLVVTHSLDLARRLGQVLRLHGGTLETLPERVTP